MREAELDEVVLVSLVYRARHIPALDIQRNPSDQHFAAVTAPGFGRGRRLLQTSCLNASIKLAFQAAAAGGEALPLHADTYGGAVVHAPFKITIGRLRSRLGMAKA